MITREEIQAWLTEQLAEINEQGQASAVALMHFGGTGSESEIHSMKSGGPKWGKVDEMADVFHTVATRHARGLIGQQQFMLNCYFGGSGKPSRFLPFGMAGALQFGPLPGGGGLSTEQPTAVGQLQQGMRLLEILVQGSFAKDKHVSDTMMAIISDLRQALTVSQTEVRELWVAIKEIVVRVMEAEKKAQLDVIAAKRNAVMLQELFRLFPALLNGVSGRNIFPVAAGDTALLRGVNMIITEDQLSGLSLAAQQQGPEAQAQFALLSNRLQQLRKEEAEQAKKVEQLAGETVGDDFAAAARDATGQAFTTLRRVARGGDGNGGSNGSSGAGGKAPLVDTMTSIIERKEGEPDARAPEAQETASNADPTSAYAAFGESFFARSNDADIQSVAMFMRGKGADDVADRMIAGYEVFKRARAEAAAPVDSGAPPEGEKPAPTEAPPTASSPEEPPAQT